MRVFVQSQDIRIVFRYTELKELPCSLPGKSRLLQVLRIISV